MNGGVPSRRGFLGLLAAAPISAKQAAESAMSGLGVVAKPPVGSDFVAEPSLSSMSLPEWLSAGIDVARRKLSPWRRREMERDAGVVHSVDPDIAALRSVSLASKVIMQRRRQIARAESEIWLTIWLENERHNARNGRG